MSKIDIDSLIENVKNYTNSDVEVIKKAYETAKTLHSGQYRESGEEFIMHPLSVALILSEMHADVDTICAGLLHDTLEDTKYTKEDIVNDFNETVASLVDGVTKLKGDNVEVYNANERKIILGITEDVRIIIVKLADRLHNMRTISYKSIQKQREKAMETMEIYVPLAYYIGAYNIKSELEDISLSFLYKDEYNKIKLLKEEYELSHSEYLKEAMYKINNILSDNNIPNTIKMRTKNVYAIYKRINEGAKISDIHDLLTLKIVVDTISNCYNSLYYIHSTYNPLNEDFKDYICNPKVNMYQGLHTTVFGPNGNLIQNQIRTKEMDVIATSGLISYFDYFDKKDMQKEVQNKYKFLKSIEDLNEIYSDNREFVENVKTELFGNKIQVYTSKGDVIELPSGSTVIDYAYKVNCNLANMMNGCIINGEKKSIYTTLNNKDRVNILTDINKKGPSDDWEFYAKTSYAKDIIKKLVK